MYNNVQIMKTMSRRPEPKFSRKPTSSIQKAQLIPAQEQTAAGSSSKKLSITNNVLNLIVMASNELKQMELSRLLFTNQKSLEWRSSTKIEQQIQNSTLSKKMFLEYSPDSVMGSPYRRSNTLDSEILIEGYEQGSEKANVSTNPPASFTFQKSDQCNQLDDCNAKVSPFELTESSEKKAQGSSISLSLITSNQYIFMVNYSYRSEARTTLSEDPTLFHNQSQRLIKRIRTLFKKSPSHMFKFYAEVLQDYEHLLLRQFLMTNSIKYTTNQITSLEKHIDRALDMCKGQDVLQFMFFTEEEDDMIVVNFSDSDVQSIISPPQINFWKTLAPIFQIKQHQKGVIAFEIRKIEEFILKLI